jgi:flagellar protein FliO/FliZ
MQFLTSLFGGTGNTVLTAVLALGIVLLLIVLCVWVLKFVFKASSNVGFGRNRRLMLVDSMSIDSKRQLLIVRRDNVEHLILTGGPQDLLLESGIAVEKTAPRRAVPIPVVATRTGVKPDNPFLEPDEKPEARLPASAVERLKDFARPVGQRTSTSLRHTGLMRPVSRMEVIPGYLDNPAPDSAKTTALVEAKGGGTEFPKDDRKAGEGGRKRPASGGAPANGK